MRTEITMPGASLSTQEASSIMVATESIVDGILDWRLDLLATLTRDS
jgi:hypothetical protein